MGKIRRRLFFLATLALPGSAPADMVLIANPEAAVERLTRDEAVNIYMGRLRRFPSGQAAQPLDSPEKAVFYRLLVHKELADINAYWARLVFSGRASPPFAVDRSTEVVERVARNRDALGYVDRAEVDGRVKIVLELER